jgi:hypothetical protein
MATTNTLTTIPADAENDPFRYGWRYLRREEADGTEGWERVPLTLEDVLHPQEEDFILQNRLHHLIQEYLRIVFAAQLAHDPTAVVLADVRVAWDVPGLEAHGPDIAVITGVRELKNWGLSMSEWREFALSSSSRSPRLPPLASIARLSWTNTRPRVSQRM